ncbi:hypothetical protein BABINDRAFT_160684 [Babjeviella inositovora NRRL Y-12698]|uniref:Calcineurin-like phosphoesterase domain-containing protein n=1 Tax=Babjeviella inositovora NRRL Y-12698 TaxID=984486 RepID=A0A1E3QUH0_9ASCO|nr:uncharacterized protein BABINDRAFT_160684 [Babjeviella inositovora NRRL Y-12698]ODQ81326.1 hypothetical protein BABINDRAFT_160684 [Babjeviella inositovora NRRL Y-12698]
MFWRIFVISLCIHLAYASFTGQTFKQKPFLNLHPPEDIDSKSFIDKLYAQSSDTCTNCKKVLAHGVGLTQNTPPEQIVAVFLYWCTTKLSMSEQLCNITYKLSTSTATMGTDFTNLLVLIEDPLESLDGDYYCHFKAGGACPLPPTPAYDLSSWWSERPSILELEQSTGFFNVAHLSDFHVELDYAVGGEANCTDSMCCTPRSRNVHTNSGQTPSTDFFHNSSYTDFVFVKGDEIPALEVVWQPAHEFGEYTCDTPELLLNNSLKHVRDTNQVKTLGFEFALFTGDMVDHDDLYHTTMDTTIHEEIMGFRDMKAWLGDIPVYSVLGNHDTFPYGQLAQESLGFASRFTWNDELMGDLWEESNWVPRNVSKHYTGFSVVTRRGLKVISLNSNVWYTKNMYAYAGIASNPDSFGSLRWLIDELTESEELGQRVWLQAHIPFANVDTLPISSHLLGEIVARFSPYTIAAIFFGHTHKDQFQVQYGADKDPGNVVNMAWISQSIAPLFTLNPSWRYYQVDSKTFSVMDSLNFYQRLNETVDGEGNEPEWQFEYSAREVYTNVEFSQLKQWEKSTPLNATFWHYVAEQIGTNASFNQVYTNHQFRYSPATPDCFTGLCDDNYCYVSSFTRDAYLGCNNLEALSYHIVGSFWDV